MNSNQASLLSRRVGYLKYGDHATDTVSDVTYKIAGGKADRETYSYDADGRVCAIRENGRLKVKYTYDALGRLVREDNRELALTTTFEYDCGGAIDSGVDIIETKLFLSTSSIQDTREQSFSKNNKFSLH